MSTMSYEANGQRLVRSGSTREGTFGPGDPLYLDFTFLSGWEGSKIAVSFWMGDEEDAYLLPPTGVVKVPNTTAALGFFRVSLTRREGDRFYKTNKAAVRVRVAS